MKVTIVFIITSILIVSLSGRSIINVPDDYSSIQESIEMSQDGDIILVQPGEYYENINYQGKSITIGSLFLTTDDVSYADSTIINGNGEGSVVTFEYGEFPTSILSGFTIKNGYSDYGGGIYCDNSNPTLNNLIVRENIADSGGGGISCINNSSPNLRNLIINDNQADNGGGLFLDSSNSICNELTIYGNIAGGYGGGVLCCNNASPTFYRTIIDSNYAVCGGGGISCGNNCFVKLYNMTIINNESPCGGGIFCGYTPNVVLINSIVWSNSSQVYFYGSASTVTMSIAYCDIEGGENSIITNGNGEYNWLEGNITQSPNFVNPDENNYNLMSGFPCIDSGIDSLYYQEDIFLINYEEDNYYGLYPEMGACEYEYLNNDMVFNLYVDMGMTEFDILSVCGNVEPLSWDFMNNMNILEPYQDNVWTIQIIFVSLMNH